MKKKQRMKMSGKELGYQICINTFLVIVLICCIIPMLYVIGMSLSSEGEMIERNYFIIIPHRPILKAYEYIFTGTDFLHGLWITVCRTAVGALGSLLFPITLGYILAKNDFPFQKPILIFIIITMILPGGLIPNYLLLNKLHLLNTFWVYILPGLGNAYNVLVVKLFVEGLPKDIMESADLDGASELAKLRYIALPLLKPTICAVGLFSAVAHWNEWFSAMIYVRNTKLYPVQYIIRNLFAQGAQVDLTNNISAFEKMTLQSMKMASVVIAVLPIICVYPFLQKYFIYGMYTGAVKE